MQFSVHINPLPRQDRPKLPLQLFSITENMEGGAKGGCWKYRDGSLWDQLVHSSTIGSFHGSRQLYLLCAFGWEAWCRSRNWGRVARHVKYAQLYTGQYTPEIT